jgi:hypothetical protein
VTGSEGQSKLTIIQKYNVPLWIGVTRNLGDIRPSPHSNCINRDHITDIKDQGAVSFHL